MARQLTLLDSPPAWRLDEATRTAGRKGIADARASLRAAIAAQHGASATPSPSTTQTSRRRTAA